MRYPLWRHAAIGTWAALLIASAGPDCHAQDRTPQPPAPHKAASDFLTADVAQSILGTNVEARGVGPLQCWYVETGYTFRPPNDKSVRLGVWYWAVPRADDFAERKEQYAEFPGAGAVVTDLPDFADAALWIWKPGAGGTLYAFRGGTVQVEVTISGLAEDIALKSAKTLAAGPLGGSDGTDFAYLGTPEGDAAFAALAAAVEALQAAPDAGAAAAPTESPETSPPAAPEAPEGPSPSTAPAPADATLLAIPPALTEVSGATYITQAEFLDQLEEVSLSLEIAPGLEAYISADEARADVAEALAPYGIDVVPRAKVLLEAKLIYLRTWMDWEDETRHTHEFLLSLDFVTCVAVRRGGVYHALYAAVAGERGQGTVFEANEIRKFFFGDELTPEMRGQLPILLRDVLSFIASNTNVDAAPWYAASWGDAEQAAASAAFVAVMGAPAPPEKRCDGIDSAPDYVYYQPIDDQYCTAPSGWRGPWTAAFKELGWEQETATVECPLTLLHIFRCEYMDVLNVPEYYRMMNIMQLKESNAVFELNGRLVRKPVALMSWFRIDLAFDGDGLDEALFTIDDDVDDAIDAIKAAMK